jgi:uncharacterized Zn finger protein
MATELDLSKQTCQSCGGSDVRATLRTPVVVYLRCAHCGAVWSIPDRRKLSRLDDGTTK